MLKLEIKFDEKQIQNDKKYTMENIWNALDNAFLKYQLKKETYEDGTVCYYGSGKPIDYGIFGKLITSLKNKDWFMRYVEKWLWYNSDDGENENDFSIEDVLYHYTNKESVCTAPQLLDQKSNDWRSVFLWQNTAMS